MVNMTPTLRFAALSAMVLGFACAGFVATASADDVANNNGTQKPATTDVAGHGNATSLKSNDVTDVAAGGNATNLAVQHLGVGSGGNPTGEGALLTGNCFADMAVYNKEGKFIGRGIVNTCN